MKLFKGYLPIVIVSIVLTGCERCKDDDNVPNYAAEWKIKQQVFTGELASLNGKLLESDCNNNHKMFVTFGEVPAANKAMKVVSYTKQNLAADELKIDIAHEDKDYFSTGDSNRVIDVQVNEGKVGFFFYNIPLQAWGQTGPISGDTTSTYGKIFQR